MPGNYDHFDNDIKNENDRIIWLRKKNNNNPNIKQECFIQLSIDNYLDNTKELYRQMPYFYDDIGLFWVWNNKESKYEKRDEVDIMILFDKILGFKGQTINNKIKSNTLEAMKRHGRVMIPEDAPIKWVQFKNKAYSVNSNNVYNVDSKYFFTNPIPWEIGESSDTPNMDKIFEEWVGKEYVDMLYELIAYSCYRDYPINRLFFLLGRGRNGKSKYLKIIEKFIGLSNFCSTELEDLLTSRFEKAKLYKKLVCIMGEANAKLLEKTSILKKLTGEDYINYEFKNKNPFDDINYAKIIIATNTVPQTADKTDGWYSRCIIIDFCNQFTGEKNILADIPETEYNNLAKKVTEILPKLLKRRLFTNEGDYKQRAKRYDEKSNPLKRFIKDFCVENTNFEIPFFEFYDLYKEFLDKNGFRIQSKNEVGRSLRAEGYDIDRKTRNNKTWKFINGIGITEITEITHFTISSLTENQVVNRVISVITVISELKNKYNNFIPIYKIHELSKKIGVSDPDQEIEDEKAKGTIAEFKTGHISILE